MHQGFLLNRPIYSKPSDSIHSFLKNIICTSFFSNIKLYYTQYLFFSGLETAANIEITGKILKGIDFLDLNITEPSNWMPPQSH